MTRHLRSDEVIAAVDGELTTRQRAHLEACVPCQAQVAEVREAVAAAEEAAPVPEPSPLFWDHLSARVRRATAGEPVPAGRAWGAVGWGAWLAGGVVATVILMTVLRVPQVDPAGAGVDATPEVASAGDWSDVVAVVEQLSGDDMRSVFAPEATLLVDDLSPAERAALADLLEREMGADQ